MLVILVKELEYTTGRIPGNSSFRQAGSLYLEGLLESESEELLHLKNMQIRIEWTYEKGKRINSERGTVHKDKIVTLYEIKEKES